MPDHGRPYRAENPLNAPSGRTGPGPVFVGDLLERGGRPLEKRRSRRPILLGVFAAVVGVCAALLITVQAVRSAAEPAQAAALTPQDINGTKVFHPDVIKASAGDGDRPEAARPAPDEPRTGSQQRDSADDTPAPAEQSSSGELPSATGTTPSTEESAAGTGMGTGTGPGDATTSGSPASRSPGGDLCVTLRITDAQLCRLLAPVQAFYASAPTDPAAAFAILDDSLQAGSDAETFARSWSDIESTTVDRAELVDRHAVRVQVTYRLADGSRLVTEQRLTIRGGARPRISDAQLLSAVSG